MTEDRRIVFPYHGHVPARARQKTPGRGSREISIGDEIPWVRSKADSIGVEGEIGGHTRVCRESGSSGPGQVVRFPGKGHVAVRELDSLEPQSIARVHAPCDATRAVAVA